jgi:predicted nucleic acid-binding protein
LILVDTNVFVALIDKKDALHDRAFEDLGRLRGRQLYVLDSILAETCFFLRGKKARADLYLTLETLRVRPATLEPEGLREVFEWMKRYAEHEPDFADAQLVVHSARERGRRVWTYDREFRDLWRCPNGSAVPLLVRR